VDRGLLDLDPNLNLSLDLGCPPFTGPNGPATPAGSPCVCDRAYVTI